jgi:hypothetical protein
MKTLLLATFIIGLTVTSASAQSFCSAQGSPPCSISCPAGKTAVCNNGGLVPGQCLCR